MMVRQLGGVGNVFVKKCAKSGIVCLSFSNSNGKRNVCSEPRPDMIALKDQVFLGNQFGHKYVHKYDISALRKK